MLMVASLAAIFSCISAKSETLNMGLTKDHAGFRVNDDLISAVCSDAAHKMVTQVGEEIHQNLKEIEHGCEDKPEDDLKVCEDEQVAGILRAKKNVTLFYIGRCAEQVKKDLGEDPPTLEKAHPAADKYEEAHAAEVKEELLAQMSAEMAKKKTGPMSTPEFLCMDEVSKDIEQDGDLVHEHFLEIEEGCKKKEDLSDCENKAVTSLVAGKGKVMQDFVDHCLSPMTWTLHAMHPAIDNFGEVHKTEVHDALHEQIHEAMKKSDLESATEAFSLNRVSLGRTTLRSPAVVCMGFLVTFASLASLAMLSRRAKALEREEETLIQAE